MFFSGYKQGESTMNIFKFFQTIREDRIHIAEIENKILKLKQEMIANKIVPYCFKRFSIDVKMQEFFTNENAETFKIIDIDFNPTNDTMLEISFELKEGKIIKYSFPFDEIDDFQIFDKLQDSFAPNENLE